MLLARFALMPDHVKSARCGRRPRGPITIYKPTTVTTAIMIVRWSKLLFFITFSRSARRRSIAAHGPRPNRFLLLLFRVHARDCRACNLEDRLVGAADQKACVTHRRYDADDAARGDDLIARL